MNGIEMNFPAWFFEKSGPRIQVVVTHYLPSDVKDSAGVVIGRRHWFEIGGTLYMSREAFHELKKVAASGEEERPIVAQEGVQCPST